MVKPVYALATAAGKAAVAELQAPKRKRRLRSEWRVLPPERGFPENLLEIGWRLQQLRMVDGKHKYITVMIGHKTVMLATAELHNKPAVRIVTVPQLLGGKGG